MKIIRIFGPEKDLDSGLWSLKEDNAMSEFERVMEIWRDTEQMYSFCRYHLEDLKVAFDYDISAAQAAEELMDEADELEEELYYFAMQRPPGTHLQQLFKPLDNWRTNLTELQLSKGSIIARRRPKLRIYAVRIDENTYVVTGGAVKLTHLMEDRTHTQKQLLN